MNQIVCHFCDCDNISTWVCCHCNKTTCDTHIFAENYTSKQDDWIMRLWRVTCIQCVIPPPGNTSSPTPKRRRRKRKRKNILITV